MKLIDPKLDLELSAMICGWDELEKRNGNEDVIDMNLSERVLPKEYKYRYDVLKDIERFMGMTEIQNNPLIFRKLNAHRYYLLALLGSVISFDERLENIMGIKPVIYSDKKVQAIKERANTLLEPFNLKVCENIEEQLNKLDDIVPYNEFPKIFDSHHKKFFQEVKAKSGIDINFDIAYSQIDEDIQKIAEIRGDGKNFNVLFNMFHMKHYGMKELEYLSVHEITGHAVQFSCLRRKLDAGLMPRYLGCMTMYEPLQFSAEGLAESLQYFYPDSFDNPIIQAVFALTRLRRVVSNNASVMANRGENFEECVDYFYKNYPYIPINRIAHGISSKVNKPGHDVHYQVYSQGLETFRLLAETHADKNTFIKSVYEDFLMPDQILAQLKHSITDFV